MKEASLADNEKVAVAGVRFFLGSDQDREEADADVVPLEADELVHEERLRGLVRAVPLERGQHRDGDGEEDEYADEGGGHARDGAVQRPQEDDEPREEEEEREL